MLGIGTPLRNPAVTSQQNVSSAVLTARKVRSRLQHSGTMQGGKFSLNVIVVPDSGTDELTGISGKLIIKIEGSKHFYEFEYITSDE
jgi:hypothetical protein